ncbi:MAG: glycosyltransferase family protein [Deltaproteobacteria bacterium]|nr:glycosyltransferase family protein [Deltaproteobacteria bacterium]
MKIVGIVQARMSSTRLPGKVLLDVLGRPLILLMLERVSRCRLLDELWLATSVQAEDDPLAEAVQGAGYRVFRGSLEDVLSRFRVIGKETSADVLVRLTGDCPLHDPEVVDAVVDCFLKAGQGVNYVSNVLPPTYPDGLDVEVFRFSALERAYLEAESDFDREHVTPPIRKAAGREGRMANCFGPADFSHLRWTLDEPEDYELIRRIFEEMYPQKGNFGWLDVLAWQTRLPERLAINAMHGRNEGATRKKALPGAAGGGM